MKIPIYSRFKNYLESKGLHSATSGQIAWFGFSGVISIICGFFIGLLCAMGLNLADFIATFIFVLVFSSILIGSILVFLHKKFMPLGLSLMIFYFISVFVENSILFAVGAFAIILFWFLCNKLSIKIKILLCIVFLIFEFVWFILFFVFTNKIILA
ncbi:MULTISPECIES: hypothetical protein [unclassified Helicobacter]|uniref:hypothetical protein n=1 Tax=unclassified Helicobacter TaxID=2593540 RepID=UPI0015F13574|nr:MULTISPECIES: hypothetical protein [unclassified Helicobacter]